MPGKRDPLLNVKTERHSIFQHLGFQIKNQLIIKRLKFKVTELIAKPKCTVLVLFFILNHMCK